MLLVLVLYLYIIYINRDSQVLDNHCAICSVLYSTVTCGVMLRRGYAEAEIESVFAKFDADGDRRLNAEDVERMQADLEKENRKVEAEIERASHKQADSEQRAKDGSCSVYSTVLVWKQRVGRTGKRMRD